MGKIVNIESNIQHVIQEVICLKCFHRGIDVRPESVWLKDLECPNCGEIGFIIGTGQPITEEDLEEE